MSKPSKRAGAPDLKKVAGDNKAIDSMARYVLREASATGVLFLPSLERVRATLIEALLVAASEVEADD